MFSEAAGNSENGCSIIHDEQDQERIELDVCPGPGLAAQCFEILRGGKRIFYAVGLVSGAFPKFIAFLPKYDIKATDSLNPVPGLMVKME